MFNQLYVLCVERVTTQRKQLQLMFMNSELFNEVDVESEHYDLLSRLALFPALYLLLELTT